MPRQRPFSFFTCKRNNSLPVRVHFYDMRILTVTSCASLVGAVLAFSGCVIHTEEGGPLQHQSVDFDRDKAEIVRAYFKMGVGTMRVGSGVSDKLVRADFDYNVRSWQPEVEYREGTLRITQPSSSGTHLGNTKYEWDIRLNREVPLELNINTGAGEARLELGSLDLRRVNVEIGVGQLQMDLRGHPTHNYSVQIHGGVGEATVRLPSDVGVYAEARGGIGEISASGSLHHDGNVYFNDNYKKSPVTIRLDIQGGVGSIKLISV